MAWTFSRAQGSRGFGTALPGSPVDGDEFTLVDNTTTPTYAWRLRYDAAKASNKWVYIGGSPLRAEVTTFETTTSVTYADLATVGPSITLPVAGDYIIGTEAVVNNNNAAVQNNDMSFAIGGNAATTAEQLLVCAAASSMFSQGRRSQKKAGLGAVALVAKYKTTAGTAGFGYRVIEATPIAIGG